MIILQIAYYPPKDPVKYVASQECTLASHCDRNSWRHRFQHVRISRNAPLNWRNFEIFFFGFNTHDIVLGLKKIPEKLNFVSSLFK